jgi:hypothetical protein
MDRQELRAAVDRARRRVAESRPLLVRLRAAWLPSSSGDGDALPALDHFCEGRDLNWSPFRPERWTGLESIPMADGCSYASGRVALLARSEADWSDAAALLEGVAADLAPLDDSAIAVAIGRRSNWRSLRREQRADLLLIDLLPGIAPKMIKTGTLGAIAGGFAMIEGRDAAAWPGPMSRLLPDERPVAWAEIADIREALRALLEAASARLAEPAAGGGAAGRPEAKRGKRRTPETIAEEERKIAAFLCEHPDATRDEVAKGTGIAAGIVSGSTAWRTRQASRKAARSMNRARGVGGSQDDD